MPRKPNYKFERRERDRLKAVKNAERAAAKGAHQGGGRHGGAGRGRIVAARADQSGGGEKPAADDALELVALENEPS